MNQHQERQHGLHRQDPSENLTQTDLNGPNAGETNDRESLLDELEKMMFERAR